MQNQQNPSQGNLCMLPLHHFCNFASSNYPKMAKALVYSILKQAFWCKANSYDDHNPHNENL